MSKNPIFEQYVNLEPRRGQSFKLNSYILLLVSIRNEQRFKKRNKREENRFLFKSHHIHINMDVHLVFSQLRYSYYTHIDVCYNEIFFKYCGIIKFHGGSIFVVFEGSPLPRIYILDKNKF